MTAWRATLAAAFLALAAADAPAQQLLDSAEARLMAGDYAQARELVERWWRETETRGPVNPRTRPRGLLLRARLARDFASAERDLLNIVLGHPTALEAPEALLRLGQGLLAEGDPHRAAAYLERLLADYPGATQRLTGHIWLARARSVAGRTGAACTAARAARDAATEPEDAAMVGAYEREYCGS